MFKNECETRGIAIYNAYNIQKRLLHEVEQEELHGVKEVDDRLMELLDERGKNKVTHRYVDFISNEDSASKGTIPPRGDEKSSLPPKEEIKIPNTISVMEKGSDVIGGKKSVKTIYRALSLFLCDRKNNNHN